jgi:hypothetical protein
MKLAIKTLFVFLMAGTTMASAGPKIEDPEAKKCTDSGGEWNQDETCKVRCDCAKVADKGKVNGILAKLGGDYCIKPGGKKKPKAPSDVLPAGTGVTIVPNERFGVTAGTPVELEARITGFTAVNWPKWIDVESTSGTVNGKPGADHIELGPGTHNSVSITIQPDTSGTPATVKAKVTPRRGTRVFNASPARITWAPQSIPPVIIKQPDPVIIQQPAPTVVRQPPPIIVKEPAPVIVKQSPCEATGGVLLADGKHCDCAARKPSKPLEVITFADGTQACTIVPPPGKPGRDAVGIQGPPGSTSHVYANLGVSWIHNDLIRRDSGPGPFGMLTLGFDNDISDGGRFGYYGGVGAWTLQESKIPDKSGKPQRSASDPNMYAVRYTNVLLEGGLRYWFNDYVGLRAGVTTIGFGMAVGNYTHVFLGGELGLTLKWKPNSFKRFAFTAEPFLFSGTDYREDGNTSGGGLKFGIRY